MMYDLILWQKKELIKEANEKEKQDDWKIYVKSKATAHHGCGQSRKSLETNKE